ncbi:MAG: hypothetical protein ACTSQF_00125 [Candidatus Heimdallarchaeaceae archaeon]
MKIEKTYYDFWGKDYIYYIESKASIIAYSLSSVVDDVTTSIEYDFISPLTLLTITLPAEGQYELVIRYPDGNGTATAVYDLRCYPDLKADIIRTFKDAICNCPGIGNNPTVCSTTSMNAVQQDVNFLEMVYNSANLYRDLLMSPSFLRKYSCCFVTTLGENYYKLEALLKSLYESVTVGGYTPDSMYLLRLYTAYYYVMIYVMELDMASCLAGSGGTPGGGGDGSGVDGPDESGSTCEDEVAAVVELFNPSELKECFIKLGLNFNEIYNSFRLCYLQNPIGLCITAEEVTPPPPPPGVATIDNLTYLDYVEFVEIGTDVLPSIFQWEITGTPENLILTDNVSQIVDVSVTGTSYNCGAETYNLANKGSVSWRLRGDNVNTIDITTQWIYPAYWGKNITGTLPNETEIKNGTKIISGNLKNEVLFTPNTAITEYGWVAVPTPEAIQYISWEVGGSALNAGDIGMMIGSTEFILTDINWTVVDGTWYAVYIYSYPSEVSEEIRLSNP